MTITASDTHAPLPQGDVRLLGTDQARELLQAAIPVRLAFVTADGTPRIVPSWFHWTGTEVVMATYIAGSAIGVRHPAARVAALRARPRVALTIDTEDNPPRALSMRGTAEVTEVDGLAFYSLARAGYGDQLDAGEFVEMLGIRELTFTAALTGGGGGSAGAIGLARAAIVAGDASVVVTVMALQQRTRLGSVVASKAATPASSWPTPP